MDPYQEISDVLRKASLASISKPVDYVHKLTKEERKPEDRFYLVHVLCLFFGVLTMLPLSFFVTANSYWMYKFRDVSKDTVDLNNKTTLQKYFVSGSLVVQTVPSIIFMLLSTIIGHRFKVHSRIIVTLSLVNSVFVIFTIFIKVNTDTWQLAFFLMSLLGMSLLAGDLNLFQVSCLAIVPKFPEEYMKTYLFGQGMAGIFSAVLQITSLALGTSTETSALFYFISGVLVISITLLLYLFCYNLSFYQYYININLEEKKKTYSKADVKTAFFQIWPAISMICIMILTLVVTHPTITSLVVSEYYPNGHQWNDVYFLPTITFLFSEMCSQMGRLMSRSIITKSNGSWMVLLTFLRMLIMVPLVMLCNAQPRNNLPVLLKHDWQYILVLLVYFFSSGFLLNAATLSIPRLAPENQEVAYLVMAGAVGVIGGMTSPLSLLAVRLL